MCWGHVISLIMFQYVRISICDIRFNPLIKKPKIWKRIFSETFRNKATLNIFVHDDTDQKNKSIFRYVSSNFSKRKIM